MNSNIYVFLANHYLQSLKDGFITIKDFTNKIDTLLDCTEFLEGEGVMIERRLDLIKKDAVAFVETSKYKHIITM